MHAVFAQLLSGGCDNIDRLCTARETRPMKRDELFILVVSIKYCSCRQLYSLAAEDSLQTEVS